MDHTRSEWIRKGQNGRKETEKQQDVMDNCSTGRPSTKRQKKKKQKKQKSLD